MKTSIEKYKPFILLACLVAGGVAFTYFDVVNLDIQASGPVNAILGAMTMVLLVFLVFLGYKVRERIDKYN